MHLQLQNALNRLGSLRLAQGVSRHSTKGPKGSKLVSKFASTSSPLDTAIGMQKNAFASSLISMPSLSRRSYSTRMNLYEDEEPVTAESYRMDRTELLDEEVEEGDVNTRNNRSGVLLMNDAPIDWKDWDPSLHHFLDGLHRSDMTLELAKKLWSEYKMKVGAHPELAAFLPLMFRQLSPYLYFDHIEALYSDIVETNQLSTVIGRDMVRHYMKRNDLANAEVVKSDLVAAGQDISGSTMGMLIRLSGYAGITRKVWEYFDQHIQTPTFQARDYPYLCGSLFLALGQVPGNQDQRILSILHLMISGEEYHPNAPGYYRWLEEHGLDEPNDETPDFPIQPSVRLPPPDSFCFNVSFVSIRTVEAANAVWEIAQKLRRVTQHVYANYILCLSNIDIALAVKVFRQFILTSYATKGWNTTLKLRRELVAKATEALDLDSLLLVVDERSASKQVYCEDIVNVCLVHMKLGRSIDEVLQIAVDLCEKYNVTGLSIIMRGIIFQSLQLSKPEFAEAALAFSIEKGYRLYYHHWTPIPLYHLHKWVNLITENRKNGITQDEKERNIEERFLKSHESIFRSELGPSSFYLKILSALHPNDDFVLQSIDRAIKETNIKPPSIVFALMHANLPFERGYRVITHLEEKYQAPVAPLVAKAMIQWAVADKKYEACFKIATKLVENILASLQTAPASSTSSLANGEGQEAAGQLTPRHLQGSWVHLFTGSVLRPLGIKSHLHRYYGFHKYAMLSREQTLEFQQNLAIWYRTASHNGFQEKAMVFQQEALATAPIASSKSSLDSVSSNSARTAAFRATSRTDTRQRTPASTVVPPL